MRAQSDPIPPATQHDDAASTRSRLLVGGAAAAAAALVGSAVRAPGTAYGATAPMEIVASSPSTIPLIVKGAPGQEAELQRWNDATGAKLASVDHAGQVHHPSMRLDTTDQGPSRSPELHYKAANGFWLSGIDWAAPVPARDHVIAAKVDHPTPGTVRDFIYAAHRGTKSPTLSIGNSSVAQDVALVTLTGPSAAGGTAVEPSLAGVLIRHPFGATAPALAVRRSWSGANLFAVLPDGSVQLRTASNLPTLRLDAETGALSGPDANTPVVLSNRLNVESAPGAGNFEPLLRVRQDGDAADRFRVRSDGAMFWGSGTEIDPGTQLWRYGPGILRSEGKIAAKGGIGFANAVRTTTIGAQSRAFEIFNDEGRSIGYVPIHSS